MKTLMKALRAPLFLAVIAALLASCAPEIKLSDRDWGQVTAGDNTRLVSETGIGAPVIAWNNDLNYRDVDITFDEKADVLRANNDNIVKEMKNFLKFYAFTRGSGVTAPDTLGTEYDYSFVRRAASGSNTIITVKLADAWNVSNGGSLVAKVFASKYTFANGKKLCGADDTEAGDDYYDAYTTLQQITVPTGLDAGSYDFQKPYRDWNINLGLGSPDPDEVLFIGSVAAIDLGELPDYPAIDSAARNRIRDEVVNALTGELVLQKFVNNNWVDEQATFTYISTGALLYGGTIRVTYSPAEFVPYRVKMKSAQNLKTAGTYFGVQQRLRVNGKFNEKVRVTDATVRIDTTKTGRVLYQGVNILRGIYFESLNAGEKNVKLRLVFKPIVGSFISNMDLKTFKDNVKIAVGASGGAVTDVKLNETEFLDIQKVEYPQGSEVTLTLNSSYSYDYLSGKQLTILIAPGFTYTNPDIIFGNYAQWDWVIDGVRNFDLYDTGKTISPWTSYQSETSRIISFNANGGDGRLEDIIINETPRTLPTSGVSKTGNVLIGWSSGSTFYSTSTSYTYAAFPGYRTTLYAIWAATAPATTYTVTFNVNGGTGPTPPAQAGIPSGYNVPLPSGNGLMKDGKVFLGWADSATATYPVSSYSVVGNVTLYAVYGAYVPPVVPDTPVNLTVDNKYRIFENYYGIDLSWWSSPGATFYIVYRNDSYYGDYEVVGYVSAPSYTDYVDTPNTRYYYMVRAGSSEGLSGSIIENTLSPIEPVTYFDVNSTTSNSVTLSWDPVAGASFYKVYISTDGVSYEYKTQVYSTSSNVISSLSSGTMYYFKVTAVRYSDSYETDIDDSYEQDTVTDS